MTKNIDLDLDALAPSSAYIKFGGKEIEVKPPSTEQILKLTLLGQKLQERYSDEKDIAEENIIEDLNKLSEVISDIIPELKGSNLNFKQIIGISKMIAKISTPDDAQELKERGVSPVDNEDGSKKN